MNSRYLEGADMLEAATHSLERKEPEQQRDLTLARILDHLGWLYIRLGRLEEAKDVLERSSAIYQALEISPPSAMGSEPMTTLGVRAMVLGDYAKAARIGERARQVSEARADQWNLMFAHYVLANATLAQGKFETAQRHAQQADNISRTIGSRWFRSYLLNDLGRIARALSDLEGAKEHHRASYAIREALDDPEGIAVALNHLGEIARLQNDYEQVEALYRQSLAIYQDIGDRGGLAASLDGLGNVALASGEVQEARERFCQALQIASEIQFVPLTLSIVNSIGELLLQTGRAKACVELLSQVVRHPASDREAQDQAGRLLTRCKAELSPEAFADAMGRGKVDEFESVVASLQIELAAPENPVSRHLGPSEQALIDPLTPRELEVLGLIAGGLSNKEIAEALVITTGTVKWYARQIFSKLGVGNRTQAVAHARELKLLS